MSTNDKRTIKRNGMSVDCYGEFEEDSNVLVVGDYSNGMELEDIWAGDGWDKPEPPKNWTEVVEHLTEWAAREGHEIMELSAC